LRSSRSGSSTTHILHNILVEETFHKRYYPAITNLLFDPFK
jgi:hypothetical protein